MIRFLLLFLLLPGVEPIANKTDDLESSKESSPMAEDRVPVTTQPKIQSSPLKFRQHKSKEPASQILPSMDAKLSHLLEKSPLTAPAKVHSIHGERRAVSTSKQNGSSLHTSSMPHTGHTHSSKRSAVLRNGNAADLALKLKSKKATIPQARDIKIPTEKGLAGTEGLGWILLHEINMTMQGEGHIHSTVTTSSPELSTRAKDQQITPVKRPLKHGFSESPTENRKNVGSPTKPQHSRLLKNKSIIDLPSDLPPRTLENGSTSSFHVELPNITYVSSNVTFPAILLEKETVPNSHIASERLQISTTDVAEATKAVLGDQRIINSTEKMTLTSQGDRNNDISRPLLFEELDAHLTGETRPAHADGDSKVILKAHDIDLLKNLPNQSRRSNFSSTAIPIQPDSATQKLPVKLTSARPEIDIKTLTQALQIEKGSSHQALEEVQSQSNTQPGLGSTTKLRRPGNTSVQTGMQTKAEAEFTTVNPRKIHTHSQGHHSVTNHGKIYKLTQPIFTSAQPATHQHDANKHLHFGQGSKTQTVPNIKKGESVTSKGAHKRAHQHSPTTKTDKMLSSMFPPGLHETATQTPPVKTTAALLGINWFGTSTQTDPGKVNMTQPGIGLIDSNKTAYTQGTSSIQEDLTSAKTIGSHPTVTERLLQFTTQTLPELAKYSIAGQAMDRFPELVSHTNPVGSDWITPTISANSELSANSEPELSTTKKSVLTTKSRIESSSNRLPELTTKSHLETSSNRQPELSSKRQAGPSTNMQHSELSTYSPLELSKWSQQELSTKRQLQLTKQNQTELSTYSHIEQPSQSRLPNKSKSELSTESWLVITTHKHFMSSTVAQSEFSTVSQTEWSTNNQLTLSTQIELEKSTKSNPDITANNQTAESESIRTEFSTNNQTTFTTNSYPFIYTRKQLEVTTETQSELPKMSQTEITTMMQPEHSTDNLPELFTQKQLESSSPWYWDESTKSQLELSTQGHQDLLSPHNQPEHSTQSLPTPYTYNQTESSTTNHPVTILTLRTPLEADITTDIEPRSATPSPGRREPNVETAPSRGTEPYTFTQIYPWLSSIKNSGSQPELATQTASLGQTHTTQSKTQLFTETQPRLITQTQGESSILDEQTNTNELTSTSTDKTQVTTTQHGPKWQTELTLEPRARSSKASETVADSHGDNVSETARNTSHSPSFPWDSGINPTWTHKDTSKSIANMLPATANGFNGLTTTEDAITMVARSGQGQISEVSHTVQLNPTLQLKTTTLTPRSLSDRGPVQPETDRIFIVDEQLPVFKVEAINVTYRMQLNMALSALCDQPDTCQALLLQEMASVYKAVPGFDRIEVQNITLDRMLEYQVQLRVEAASAMSDTLELALSDPTWLFRASHRSEDSFTSRVRSVSMAEDHADPCTDWLSCPLGFQCLSARSLGARCHSPCHSGFCHNRGICVHRKKQEPECQCPVGRDFWYMGQTCDYRMTHQRLTGIACAIVLCIIICAAAVVYILVRRFQTQILQQKLAQTQSSYRRFSRFDDVPTHFWCPSQTWLTASASLNSLDNPAFSSSEEVFPLQALGSCVCGCQEGAQKCVQTSPMQPPMGDPPRLETSGSSINDLMIDSGKASDVSVSSWPMEPIHWTPFPILHQLSLQSPFHARRPHSYFEGMELVNTERSWTA